MINSVSVSITGDDTGYAGSRIRGKILAIKCVAPSTIDDNFDLTITGETTGVPILTDTTVTKNTTTWWHPRALISQNTDGVAGTDALDHISVLNERIKIVQANASAGETTITVIYDATTQGEYQ
jgi:orotate phosphoribosyltransferase-like protein